MTTVNWNDQDEDILKKASDQKDNEPLFLTPIEVSRLFGVDPKTVTRWANAGKLEGKVRIIRTPGNHRRFRREDIYNLLEAYDA